MQTLTLEELNHWKDTYNKVSQQRNALLEAVKVCRSKWGRLHDIISDLVESGKLNEQDFPDDYQAIVQALLGGNVAETKSAAALKAAGLGVRS